MLKLSEVERLNVNKTPGPGRGQQVLQHTNWTHGLKTRSLIAEEDNKWTIPTSWHPPCPKGDQSLHTGVAHQGIFEATYVLDKEEDMNIKFRQHCAQEAGWLNIAPLSPKIAASSNKDRLKK